MSKYAKVETEDSTIIIRESDTIKDNFEVTLYFDPDNTHFTIFLPKEKLVRLIGQLEITLDLL
jgi:hypothetical protein